MESNMEWFVRLCDIVDDFLASNPYGDPFDLLDQAVTQLRSEGYKHETVGWSEIINRQRQVQD